MTYQDLLNLPLSAFTPGQGDPSMEGGMQTASGAPMYTLEDFLAGLAPYVTGATNVSPPSGDTVTRMIGGMSVPVKITDYGPGVGGLDIASKNPSYATNFPYQGQTGGGGAAPTISPNDPANFGSNIAQGIGTGAPSDSGFDNNAVGAAVIGAAKSSGAKGSQQSQEAMQKALQMITNRKEDPRLQSLQKDNPLAALLTTSANNGALQQLLATYFGQMR